MPVEGIFRLQRIDRVKADESRFLKEGLPHAVILKMTQLPVRPALRAYSWPAGEVRFAGFVGLRA